MKRQVTTAILVCSLLSALLASTREFGEMVDLCRVSFVAKTQAGDIRCHVAVCTLDSALGSSSSLYVVTACEREYPPAVVRILEEAHSPVIEMVGDRITILFTSGANTTCVAEFSISKGVLEYLTTQTIAWNDRGVYRTSPSFGQYATLLLRRDREYHQPPKPALPPVRPDGNHP